jgi:hypothetical protein
VVGEGYGETERVNKDQEVLERWERERESEIGIEGDFIVVTVEEEVDC